MSKSGTGTLRQGPEDAGKAENDFYLIRRCFVPIFRVSASPHPRIPASQDPRQPSSRPLPRVPFSLACRTGVFFCVFQANRDKREEKSTKKIFSRSPPFARKTQKITPVLQATSPLSLHCKVSRETTSPCNQFSMTSPFV